MKTRIATFIVVLAATAPAMAEPLVTVPELPRRAASLAEQTITYGELLAIGTGAIVGSSLAGALVDQAVGVVGTLLGAWAGDYLYGRVLDPRAVPGPCLTAN